MLKPASHAAWLDERAADRERDGLRRTLRPRRSDDVWLDLASNDYLGLSRDPRVTDASIDAVRVWGAGATGSRLVTGTTQLHADLEQALAAFLGAEAALVFSSGYAANLGVVSALAGPDSLVVSDAGNHASIVDACRLSRSRVVVTPHNDVKAVEIALRTRGERRALVVTDAVFSTDGDIAPIADLHDVCRAHDAVLVVDEAHALGVIGPGGRGVTVASGLDGCDDVVRTVTLSKALGSQGGAVLAGERVVEHLLNTARSFIFDTGLAPACAGAALAALRVLAGDPRLVTRVLATASALATAVGAPPPTAAVVSLVLGDPLLAASAAEHCRDNGVLVGCFRPPSVPAGSSRLRLTARADLTGADVQHAADVIVDAVTRHR